MPSAAVHFLPQTFLNVLCVRIGKLFVRLWRLQHLRTVVWGGSRWRGSWKTATTAAAGAGATPTVDTPHPYANRTPTSDLLGRYFAWNWKFLLLCSLQLWQQLQRCRQTRKRVPLFFDTFYFHSAETDRRERHVCEGSEQLQASAHVKRLADGPGCHNFLVAGSLRRTTTRYFFLKSLSFGIKWPPYSCS